MRLSLALLSVLVAMLASAASAPAAEVHRFKMDLTVRNSVDWHQSYRERAWCGQDYHREYEGTGHAGLSVRVTGKRIGFTVRRSPVIGTYLVSTAFRVPAIRTAQAQWAAFWAGTPGDDCPAGLPAADADAPDTSACGPARNGRLWAQLNVVRGRMWLSGSFGPPDGGSIVCDDPSWISVKAGTAGPSARRRLLRPIRAESVPIVRSGARVRDAALAAEDLDFTPSGAGNELRSAGGRYSAAWKLTLTRIRG
jgi:hypothetical protein